MTLVERLREDARGGHAYHELSDEAADEIERLLAVIARLEVYMQISQVSDRQ